jgi:hypothetical protein
LTAITGISVCFSHNLQHGPGLAQLPLGPLRSSPQPDGLNLVGVPPARDATSNPASAPMSPASAPMSRARRQSTTCEEYRERSLPEVSHLSLTTGTWALAASVG